VKVCYTVGIAKFASDKKFGRLKNWKALDFKKCGLEPSSLIEVMPMCAAPYGAIQHYSTLHLV